MYHPNHDASVNGDKCTKSGCLDAWRQPSEIAGGTRWTALIRNAVNATHVGIVWGVRDEAEPLLLVTDCTSLAEAEPYGDFLTHPRGHYEVWEGWRRRGAAGLARRGLPTLIAWHEYEHFPRGRVVFDTTTHCFTLYADQKLQAPGVLHEVLCAFGLDPTRCAVRSDPHYQS